MATTTTSQEINAVDEVKAGFWSTVRQLTNTVYVILGGVTTAAQATINVLEATEAMTGTLKDAAIIEREKGRIKNRDVIASLKASGADIDTSDLTFNI